MGEVWVVSRCLLGAPCRYDGKSKGNAAVAAFLRERCCTVVDICPELDCGLGCPRLPIHQCDREGRIVVVDSEGTECSSRLDGWMRELFPRLSALRPAGFLLKSRSPSCGLGDVLLEGREHPGDGYVSAVIRERFGGVRLLRECDVPGGAEAVSDEKLLKRAVACAQGLLARSPSCHDWDHTLRVWQNVKRLMALTRVREPSARFNGLAVELAAILHDIARPRELEDCGKTNHAAYGADLVKEWLPALGIRDEVLIGLVSDCVRSHRYRRREGSVAPATLEARLVYDGDKLDSIGAIGIGRSFHFAGRVGARVHNHAEEALGSASYSREDSAYREYLVKLRHVRDRMLTIAGRELAEERHGFMVSFFDELNRECFGEEGEGNKLGQGVSF